MAMSRSSFFRVAQVALLFALLPLSRVLSEQNIETVKSPSGNITATWGNPPGSLLIKRNGDTIIIQELFGCAEFSDFRWSPDETMLAVAFGPLPRRYDFYIFDLVNKKVVFNVSDGNGMDDAREILAGYFKKQVPSVFGKERPNNYWLTAWPDGWKDNKTLKLSFTLHPLDEGHKWTSGVFYTAYANARFTDNRCRLIGQPYGIKENHDH